MAEKSAQEIRDSFRHLALVMSAVAENAAHTARAKRALYQAYVAEGFTEQQALELCKGSLL